MGQAPNGETYNDKGLGLPLIAGAGDFGPDFPIAKKFTSAPTKTCEPGDIIMSIRATIGTKILSDGVYCIGRGVAGLRPTSEIDIRYLWHWLSSAKNNLASLGRGATFPQVSRDDIGGLEIALPPLDEQRRIAAILDRADDLRRKRKRAADLLDGLTQSIFLEMFGDSIENTKRWPVVALENVVSPLRKITYGILKPGPDQPGGIPYVRVVDIQNSLIAVAGLKRTTAAIASEYKRSMLKVGDLLISIRGHVGRMAIAPLECDGANITQDTARLAITEANTEFVKAQLETESARHWMKKRTKGAAVKGINLGDLRLFPLILPPRQLQEEFADKIRIARTLLERSSVQNRVLNSLFASLQSRAFSGQL